MVVPWAETDFVCDFMKRFMEDSRGFSLATVSPLKRISLLKSLNGQFWSSAFQPPYDSTQDVLSLTTYTLMTASCSQLYVSFASGDSAAALSGL